MRQTIAPAQYLQIALDISGRIASGDLPEGTRLYGRSVMASEYSVSPETIRRALRLLSDMKVVEIKPQSGIVVLSADSARRYIDSFSESAENRRLRSEIQHILDEYQALGQKLTGLTSALIRGQETFTAAKDPLPHYELPVPADSPLLGKSIGSLHFWQSTGGTIVAIRRGQTVILSPGPYAELYGGDILVLVGNVAAAEAARRFLASKESKA